MSKNSILLRKVNVTGRVRTAIPGLLLVLAACFASSSGQVSRVSLTPPAMEYRDTVPAPEEIYNDGGSGLGAMRAVIQTPAELARVWEVLRRDKLDLPPEVDFSKRMVVVAGMGWQREGGYRIRISSVRDTAGLLEITVEMAISTADCTKAGYASIDHPTVMVLVPKSQSTAVFRDRVSRKC